MSSNQLCGTRGRLHEPGWEGTRSFCDQHATLFCRELQLCYPGVLVEQHSDRAVCEARLREFCEKALLPMLSAPGVRLTIDDLLACYRARAAASCEDLSSLQRLELVFRGAGEILIDDLRFE